ncbi:2OG-Fe(II) oxygenase [Neisseriaceae bacterium TC5R-5]|nr:2OG-Fe(II) oxygenase [Neisseriaceae bacterium TC5R-5]
MSDLFDLLQIIPNAISSQECHQVIEATKTREHSTEAYYESSAHAATGQSTQSTFIATSLKPESTAFKIIHSRTKKILHLWLEHLEVQKKFNTKLLRQCLRYSHDYRVLRYDVGAKIHPHTDWDVFTLASCTLALNDDYQGGEFVFFNGERRLKLAKGQALIWPADCFWVHEITPVTSGVRYSVNSFITSIPESLKQQVVEQLNSLPNSHWQSPYRHQIE